MTDVRETKLPGLGVRFDFVTARGTRLGVLHHRTGRRELLVYREDSDAPRTVIALDEEDSRTLAEILGGSKVEEELEQLHQHVEGLAIDWLVVVDGSPFAGETIGDTQARTRTGVSVVAALRADKTYPAPGPDFRLEAEDTLVVVGTPRGIEDLAVILRTG